MIGLRPYQGIFSASWYTETKVFHSSGDQSMYPNHTQEFPTVWAWWAWPLVKRPPDHVARLTTSHNPNRATEGVVNSSAIGPIRHKHCCSILMSCFDPNLHMFYSPSNVIHHPFSSILPKTLPQIAQVTCNRCQTGWSDTVQNYCLQAFEATPSRW